MFAEFGIPKILVSGAVQILFQSNLKNFADSFNIDQAVTSLYHHQNNRHVEACIKFVKYTMKKFRQTKNDHFALFQIRSPLVGVGLPNPAMMLLDPLGHCCH